MDKSKYIQAGFKKTLAHFIEECGESLAAAGKTQRWGLECYNPELPEDQRETNKDWLLREISDLENVIVRLKQELGVSPQPTPQNAEALKWVDEQDHVLQSMSNEAALTSHHGDSPPLFPAHPWKPILKTIHAALEAAQTKEKPE